MNNKGENKKNQVLSILVYEQIGRRKLGHDPFRHGRLIIITKQRIYSLYKAKQGDTLYCVYIFSYLV